MHYEYENCRKYAQVISASPQHVSWHLNLASHVIPLLAKYECLVCTGNPTVREYKALVSVPPVVRDSYSRYKGMLVPSLHPQYVSAKRILLSTACHDSSYATY